MTMQPRQPKRLANPAVIPKHLFAKGKSETVTLIPFEWSTPLGIQAVVLVDRKRLH